LVGAEGAARLRHADRLLLVAAEHHLDLDEVLALDRAYAGCAGRALTERIGQLLGERLGYVDRLDAQHNDGRRVSPRNAQQRRPNGRHHKSDAEIADHLRALYTTRRCGCRFPPRSSSASWSCWARSAGWPPTAR